MDHKFGFTEIQINIKKFLNTKCRTNDLVWNSDHIWASVDCIAGYLIGHWLDYTHASVMLGFDR